MIYWLRYVGALRAKTKRLSLAERGAYDELLDELYSTEAGLPQAPEELFRICGARGPEEEGAVERVVARFFEVGEDGLLYQQRAIEETERAQARIKAAQENGKKGGRPSSKDKTQKNPKHNPDENPAPNQKRTQPKAIHTTDTLLPSVESNGPVGHDAPPPPQAPLSPPPPSAPAAPAPVDKSVQRKPKRKARRGSPTWIDPIDADGADAQQPATAVPARWVPPQWMSSNPAVMKAWEEFVKLRRKMNKIPFTDYARDRVIAKLEELRSAGHDAKTLLDTAIERGWRTVFDPTDRRQNPTGDRRGPERALQWWESPEGIEQKALELKVAPPPANAGPQAFTVFKVRVFIAAGDGPWIARMDVTTRRFYDAEKDKKP